MEFKAGPIIPPSIPPSNWISPIHSNTHRIQLIQHPYLIYVYGQVMYGGRGSIGYEFKNGNEDGFLLYLEIEPRDKDMCPTLAEVECVWLRINIKSNIWDQTYYD